jgi:hypothetical protein
VVVKEEPSSKEAIDEIIVAFVHKVEDVTNRWYTLIEKYMQFHT